MANDLSQDPLVIDTAHATNVVVQGGRYIHGIKCVATGASGSAILTVKSSGKVFWRGGAATALDGGWDLIQAFVPGDLVMGTCTNAVVLVYLGTER